jgi:type I restriction enzyme M protein
MPKPLPVAVLEAKKEDEDPLKGMQQAKGYSDCDRFDVKYVFASNGHRYGEFEVIDDSKLPANLTADWLEDEPNEGKPFPSYARILAKMATSQGESRYSWTIDFAKRRADARDEMQPHLDKANAIKEEVVTFKEKIKALKKVDTKNPAIKVLEEKISIQEKAARDEEAIASDIDAKVFDLKAVNPNTVIKVDMRTSKEIIENIELHGKIVAEAMRKLSLLMKD